MFKIRSLPSICFRLIIRIIGSVFLFVICSFSYGINDTDTLAVTQLTHHWEIGFTGGLSRFVTSMNPNQDAVLKKFNYWNSDKNPAFSFSLIKNFSPSISAEFEWINTKLSGIWNKNKNYKVPPIAVSNGLAYPEPFETGINEFDFLLNLKLKKLTSVFTNNKAWQLFIRAGIGLVLLKDDKALYHFDGPRNGYAYSILYGGGLSYRPSPKLAFKLGAMMSRVTTDRLDGVREIKPGQLPTGPNPYYYYNLKERYFRPYIGIFYTIGMKKKPVIEIIVRDSVPNFMDRAQFMPFLIKKTEAHLVVQYRPSIVGKVYNFYYGVGFGYDQSVLTAEAMVDIDKLAFELVTNPSVHAIIKGHTDSRGSNAYNLKLSAKRAQAVMDYLVKLGIKASRLHNRPMGESQPVNRCSDGVKCTEAEYALNRRTEILIVESEIKLDIEEDGKEVSKSVNTTSGQYIAEIQIGAFGNMVSVEKAKKMLEMIKGLPGTSVVFEDKFYKVRVIGFANREEALKYLPKLQGNGFPDARVIQVKEP